MSLSTAEFAQSGSCLDSIYLFLKCNNKFNLIFQVRKNSVYYFLFEFNDRLRLRITIYLLYMLLRKLRNIPTLVPRVAVDILNRLGLERVSVSYTADFLFYVDIMYHGVYECVFAWSGLSLFV